jgi:hypothetical protein
LFGALPWWPPLDHDDIRTSLWTGTIVVPPLAVSRPSARPNLFEDAGQVYLRTVDGIEEIWCRCDHGPHGFMNIAAHAHADALSIEVRIGGIEVLADPGTFCYHGDLKWREYFRSTLAHNTLELFGRSQSRSGGPFLWTHQAKARLIAAEGLDEIHAQARWEAEHTGYQKRYGVVHRRSVTLNRLARILTIQDDLFGKPEQEISACLAFHFGPAVNCQLVPGKVRLNWPNGSAELVLPPALNWTLHRAQTNPPLGWFSSSFDIKQPSYSVLGTGRLRTGDRLISRLAMRTANSSVIFQNLPANTGQTLEAPAQ